MMPGSVKRLSDGIMVYLADFAHVCGAKRFHLAATCSNSLPSTPTEKET